MTNLKILHQHGLSFKKVSIFTLIISFIFLKSLSISFGQVVPNNEEYLQEKFLNDSINVIYSHHYKHIIPRVKEKISILTHLFERDFNWKLDDEVSLILASPSNQISNGYATPYPYLKTTFYPGGLLFQDSFAIKSWLDTLLIHEFIHLYQISIKKTPSKINKTIFNNNPFPVFPLFAWTFPNSYLPTWILEGNAVYNESRFKNGGRLYSGESLALFNSLIKSNKVSASWLINHHLEFPFGREKYIVGGYFSWYLSKYLGSKKVNKIFDIHSYNAWNPFVINKTFQLHYGKDYYQLIEDFVKDSQKKAQKFTESKAPILLKSVTMPKFKMKNDSVVFLISKDQKSPLNIIDYNIKNKNITKSQTTLKAGQIFEGNNGKFFSAHSSIYQKRHYHFGLWDQNQNIYPHTLNKIVTDKLKDDLLYFEEKNSFQDPILYSSHKKIGICHSKGIFDKKKNVYCFRQKNTKRYLLKNNEPLFYFDGYYGKLVGAGDDRVTFISSSKLGSTLYEFTMKKKIIKRVHSSDAIVEAVALSKEEYLIAEVKSDGYHIKRITKNLNRETQPYFEKVGPKYDFVHKPSPIEKKEFKENKSSPKKYRPLKAIRYSSLQLQTAANLFYLNTYWVDPLDFYTLNISYKGEGLNPVYSATKHTLESIFESRKSLWNWSLIILLSKITNKNKLSQSIYENKQTLALQTSYPLLSSSFTKLSLINLLESEFDLKSKTLGLGLSYLKKRSFPMSYFPFNELMGKIFFKENLSTNESFLNVNGYFSNDLGNESFVSFETDFSKTSLNEIALSGLQNVIPFPNMNLSQNTPKLSSLRLSLETKKVINSSFYFDVFPISMRRSALSLLYHNFIGKYSNITNPKILGINYNIEGLILHSNVIRLNLSFFRNLSEKSYSYGLSLNL